MYLCTPKSENMKLEKIISVSGESQLMKLVTTKNNGLVLQDPITGKVKFYSVRKHQFTPLETVGIYTDTDTADMKTVFGSIIDKAAEHPLPNPKSDNDTLRDWFANILPEYDRSRVYPGDIKKVIKWYNFLSAHDYLTPSDEEE
jgi:hypothetical protein